MELWDLSRGFWWWFLTVLGGCRGSKCWFRDGSRWFLRAKHCDIFKDSDLVATLLHFPLTLRQQHVSPYDLMIDCFLL